MNRSAPVACGPNLGVVSDYAELPSAGLVEDLSSKAPVTLVGYGVQERIVGHGPPVWAGLRVRLMAPARS